MSQHRSADYKLLHAHQFTLVKQFLDLLFGGDPTPLANVGIVLGATTASNNAVFTTFDLILDALPSSKEASGEITPPSIMPYSTPDQRVLSLISSNTQTSLTTLRGLSRHESKGLLEYFAKSGLFTEAPVNEKTVNEKWSISGGGIVGELCKLGVRSRLSPLGLKSPITALANTKI